MKNKVGIVLVLAAVAAAGLFAASSIVQTAFATQSFAFGTGSQSSGSTAANAQSSSTGASIGLSAGNDAGIGAGGSSGNCGTGGGSFTNGGCTAP